MDKHLEYYSDLKFICTPLNGKVPIIKKWNKFTHTPEYSAFKNKNIGVLTGKVSNITILDIDNKDNGMKMWKQLSACYPKINTPIAITPNNGLHIYFKYNKKLSSTSRLKLNNNYIGWDILNDNRQAVLPPSIDLYNNKKYKWLIRPTHNNISQIPNWLELYINLCHK